jgi:hypothetical protein
MIYLLLLNIPDFIGNSLKFDQIFLNKIQLFDDFLQIINYSNLI